MNLNFSHNSTYDVRIDQVGDFFEEMIESSGILEKNYGKSLKKVTIFLCCLDDKLFFEKSRYYKKSNEVIISLIFNYKKVKKMTYNEKRMMVIDSILSEALFFLRGLNLSDFDINLFEKDLKNVLWNN